MLILQRVSLVARSVRKRPNPVSSMIDVSVFSSLFTGTPFVSRKEHRRTGAEREDRELPPRHLTPSAHPRVLIGERPLVTHRSPRFPSGSFRRERPTRVGSSQDRRLDPDDRACARSFAAFLGGRPPTRQKHLGDPRAAPGHRACKSIHLWVSHVLCRLRMAICRVGPFSPSIKDLSHEVAVPYASAGRRGLGHLEVFH